VKQVVVPTDVGQITVLPNHTYLVSIIAPGELVVTDEAGKTFPVAVAGGVLEVFDNTVLVLADSAEHAEKIAVAPELGQACFPQLYAQPGEQRQPDIAFDGERSLGLLLHQFGDLPLVMIGIESGGDERQHPGEQDYHAPDCDQDPFEQLHSAISRWSGFPMRRPAQANLVTGQASCGSSPKQIKPRCAALF
jgi:hypothetical protein